MGQLISLTSNRIFRFAVTLYVLDSTQSSIVFGKILAFSILPMILLSPLSGVIVDRFNRKKIMIILDFSSTLLILFLLLFQGAYNDIILLAIVLMMFSVLNAFETPTVQASIPNLCLPENITKANAYIAQVHSFSNLIGPILGGMLYGIWGLIPVACISMIGFFTAAFIEFFIYMPYSKLTAKETNIFKTFSADFKDGINFIVKEKRAILNMLVIVSVYNLFITSMFKVGLPYIIKVLLGISSQLYGVMEGLIAVGAIFGGLISAIYHEKLKMNKLYIILLLAILAYIPLGLFSANKPIVSYIMITFGMFFAMLVEAIFNVITLSFLQKETPNNLLGKISSYVVAISLCAQPIGEYIYGVLFDIYTNLAQIVVLATILIGFLIVIVTYKMYSKE